MAKVAAILLVLPEIKNICLSGSYAVRYVKVLIRTWVDTSLLMFKKAKHFPVLLLLREVSVLPTDG